MSGGDVVNLMRKCQGWVLGALCGVSWLGLVSLSAEEDRMWADQSGREVYARLVAVEEGKAVLRLRNGKEARVAVEQFSQADQLYIEEWEKSAGQEKEGEGAKYDLANWPSRVKAPKDFAVSAVHEDKERGLFVYRSPHFEFHTDAYMDKRVVKEFSELYEATYALIEQLPLQLLRSQEEKHFLSNLFERKEDYFAKGGIEGSAGMYSSGPNHIMVPMSSLGVERSGKKFKVDRGKQNTTLTHEITHQLTSRWRLPTWWREGMADFIASIPYKDGTFSVSRHEKGIKEYFYGRGFEMVPPSKLFEVTSGEWIADVANDGRSRLYGSSLLLAYFIIYLDVEEGREDGEHMLAYMNLAAEGKEMEARERYLFRDRTLAEFEKELEKAWKKEGVPISYRGL